MEKYKGKTTMKGIIALTVSLALLSGATFAAGSPEAGKSVPTREDIEEQYRWNLGDIYESIEVWEGDFEYVESNMAKIKDFRAKLGKSAANLEQCLLLSENIERKMDKLYLYAHMLKDQDTKNSESQALANRISALNQRYYQERAFLWPEIQGIPEKKLFRFVDSSPFLQQYRQPFTDMIRQKAHILSEREEELLAMAGNMSSEFSNIREALTQADIVFPKVRDESGELIELSYARYSLLLRSSDPNVRRDAFKAMYGTFDEFKNTSAATYRGSIKKDIFYAKARGYDSCIQMSLDADNVPVEVYDNLISTTHEYLQPLHRLLNLRKKIMGVEELHLYDTSVPLVAASDKRYTYEEAKALILEAVKVMGPQFHADAEKALNSRWVDVYETRNKRSGAYSWGAYDTHPYMLMNYNGTLDNVFTLIHELGHSLHTYYTNQSQPFATANYTLFVAEVASTFLENILMDHMLKTVEDKELKLALLNQWAENIQGTLYSQVLFAEFEREAHRLAEEGVPLTVETLNKTYFDILKSFYDGVLVLDPEYALTWSRIPHFFRQFYVYKYATSISASSALSRKVLSNEAGAMENYMKFLHSGCSDYPIELLKMAGVDLSTPEPIAETLQLFDDIVSQMEALVGE